MRIAYEISSAASAKPTGVSLYIQGLVNAIQEENGAPDITLLYRISRWRFRRHWFRPQSARVRTYWRRRTPLIRRPDLVHGLDAILPEWQGIPMVVTIHDLFPILEASEASSPPGFIELIKKRYADAIARSEAVVTVSESTRNDLIEYFAVPEPKVRRIYSGVDPNLFRKASKESVERLRQTLGFRREFFLYVGSVSRRKNTERLIRAYAASEARKEHDLVIAGPLSFGSDSVMSAIEELGLVGNVRMLDYVHKEDLPTLYSASSGLLFPTLYEGFGFPILEAMLCEVPVLIADRGSAPEIAGRFAVVSDPYSIESIAAGVDKIVEGKIVDLEAARDHASGFTWQRSAGEYIDLYKEIL